MVRVGGPVGDGEVADVQFLDLCVLQRYGLGLAVVLPAARGEGAVVQVDDEAALGVGGQGEGVGVGDLVGDDLARGGAQTFTAYR